MKIGFKYSLGNLVSLSIKKKKVKNKLRVRVNRSDSACLDSMIGVICETLVSIVSIAKR